MPSRHAKRPEVPCKLLTKLQTCGSLTKLPGLVNAARSKFGRLDILVNNAGIQFVSPIVDFPDEKWNDIIAINLSASFHSIKHALPIMRRQQFGRIINIASTHGLVASAQKAAYVAAKHGIIGLTKVIALETATENITCNAVCPGWVMTPLVEKQIRQAMARDNTTYEEATKNLVGQKMPSQRCADAEEVASACMWLALPGTKSTTGMALTIDGGWVAQ